MRAMRFVGPTSAMGIAPLAAVLAAVAFVALPARAAGPLLVNGAGTPLVWTVNPVPFNPDQGTLGSLSNAAAIAAVTSNFDIWAAVATSTISFTNAGAMPVDVTVANYPTYLGVCGDGLNPIIFDTDGTITDDLFGPGASDGILGFAGPDCATFVPPVITEGVAVLNGKWIDGAGPTEIPVSDFNAVFVHEFGHYCGLDHSQINLLEAFDGDPGNDNAIATMFPVLVNGAEAIRLNLDDEVSLSMLYPVPSWATEFGAITGRILRPSGSPFQGVYVIARNVAEPRLSAVGVASGYRFFPGNDGGPPEPSLEGLYEIRGLPPEDYTVEIEEIDPRFRDGSSVGPLDPPPALLAPPEFWNGSDEASTNPPDDPMAASRVAVAAGAEVNGVDIIINEFPPPPNDSCATATIIPALPFSDVANTLPATTAPDDPLLSCTAFFFGEPIQNSNSVWYTFTAPFDDYVIVDTFGTDYPAMLSLYTGTCGRLTEVDCDAFGLFFPPSRVGARTAAGQRFFIEVSDFDSAPGGGTLILNVQQVMLSGRSMWFQGSEPVKRKFKIASEYPPLAVPGLPGTLDDPTVAGGLLEIVNSTTGEQDAFLLPAARWRDRRTSLPGYEYEDLALEAGPCRSVRIGGGNGELRAHCKGAQIHFSLDEPAQGSLGVRLSIGTFRYCMLFGGRIGRDEPGKFRARGASPPTACP